MHTHAARMRFERTLAPHLDELYGAAMRLTRSPADADDVLQEAMARAWAFWDRFEEGTNVRAWMHRILFNTFVNGYRRKKREREILTQVHRERVPDPFWARREHSSTQTGLGDEVKEALATLPDTFRQAIELVDIGGKSYKDAAKVVGCPVGTIMSRLHRGRRLLSAQLRDYAIEEGYLPAAA
jgi:RNA polymerase sigma-70 factor (ECF subfamily)